MNSTTKNMIYFFLSCIGLSTMFSLFTGKIFLSIIIGIFLSISFFYGPKKNKAKDCEEIVINPELTEK
ncbi:MAG: hypothetical protein ACRC7N_12355 [Clostridium sp.]